ncbi:response regulator transcription factor [Elusimicrobiota bacterium]
MVLKEMSLHRRIISNDLVTFMKRYNMPVPDELKGEINIRILVLSNDSPSLTAINNALSSMSSDYITDTAIDEFEIGNKLALFKPDIIVIDIEQTGLDGYKIIEKIRRAGGNAKILAVSAYGDDLRRERTLKAGADSFLLKPFSTDDFIRIIEWLYKSS